MANTSQNGWINRNGVFVPEAYSLAKKLDDEMKTQSARGKFFSNYTLATGMAGLGYNKPAQTVQFDMLKQARDKSLIDKIIIMARVAQMKHISDRCIVPGKQLGFRVIHENEADPNYKPTPDVIRRCKEMERIIENVHPVIHPNGFIDFAANYMDQELTYDRKAMVITRDRTGLPIQYHLVDPTTVRPVIEVLLYWQQKYKVNQDRAYYEIYMKHGLDVTSAAYVQVVDGIPVASWTADEMSVNITNTSVEIDRWAYGAGSNLEQSLAATVTWLNAWSYNDGLFNQDSPESLLMLYGDYDPIGLGAFQRQILDQSGGGEYQKIPVIPADEKFKAELIKIRELPKDVQFAEFLRIIIQLKTAAYRAHPSIVNFTIDKGSSGGINIGNNSDSDIVAQAKEEGFVSVVKGNASWLTRTLIRPRYDDLRMMYATDLDDEKARIELIGEQEKNGMTFNEGRRAMNLKGDLEYGDIPNNPVYVQAMQAAQQEKMQSDGAAEGAKPGKDKEANSAVDNEKPNGTGGDASDEKPNPSKNLAKSEKVFTIEILN